MITDPADIVMFAIRSAIKLGQQMRLAYIDSTKRRELILPLPNFFDKPDIVSAKNYFATEGKGHVAEVPQLAELISKLKTTGGLTSTEEEEVLIYHTEFLNLDRAKAGKHGLAAEGSRISGEEFNALITIRQWQRGDDPNPSSLERLAGTFIEIGIDYFVSVPGALNKDSRQGKALAGFLQGMSEIHFSKELLGEIPRRLFVAAVETISNNPELLSADAKVQELVKVTTKSLSTDVANRIDKLRKDGTSDLVKEERIADWVELVFRGLLSSAGELVLSNPKKFLGVSNDGQAALVSSVGESVLGLVLDNSDLRMDRLFSRDGLEKITKSALAVVGEHPEILQLSNNTGLQKLISAVATELSQYDTLLTPDLLPELTRLILNKTGENLALLWPDFAKNPQHHLLITAASTTLAILTRTPEDTQKWQLRFSRADVLAVTETVFDELAANPTWLLDKTGKVNDNLKIALEAALGVLRDRADERLSTTTAIAVLRAVLLKVSSRKEFLDRMPADTPQQGQPLISAAIDVVFALIFDENLDTRAAWQVVRSDTIISLVNIGLTELARVKLSPDKVMTFAEFIKKQIGELAAGEPLVLPSLESELEKLLAAA